MSIHKKHDYGELCILTLSSAKELGDKVDNIILKRREKELNLTTENNFSEIETYQIPLQETRFSNGEGKIKISNSIRSKDVYILCDIGNYSCTYNMYGHENHMGPDEHFQNIKRTLSAIGGKARRVTVIMPLLYSSRQHKRKGRESLDCALGIKEIHQMGVKNIITFDVHDPSIQNSIPLDIFENLYPTYDVVKRLIHDEPETFINDLKNLIIISPDTGAMERALYYAGLMGADIGLFYKRRDYTKVVNGKNPILMHEYMGRDVEGKDILIVDDMISSGESVVDIAIQLKHRKANKIFIAATFALLTEGTKEFEHHYKTGLINRVYSTNLTYVPEAVKKAEWYREVDVSEYLAKIIDYLNYGHSIQDLVNDKTLIQNLVKYKK